MPMEPTTTPAGRLQELRRELPTLADHVYLNTGTAGPLPRRTARVMTEELERELSLGRGNLATLERVLEHRARVRSLVARLLGADITEIALTHNTSEGIGLVLAGTDWREGDEILTTTLEHDAVTVPLGLLGARHPGVSVRFVDIGLGDRGPETLASALTARTRLVVLSHVVYPTGVVLPVAEIARLAHQVGAAVLVDGAQAAGAMPVDVHALGADYYTVSGQKWLCGPEGTGALVVAASRIEELRAAGGYFAAEHHDHRGNVTLHPDARRFEVGMMNRPSIAGFASSLAWILDEVGVGRAFDHSVMLAGRCRERLAALPGVALVTPPTADGPLLAFDLPAFSPQQLAGAAFLLGTEERILCRSIDHPPYALRVSLGFFNTEDEVDRLVTAVEQRLLGPGPASIPLVPWAARLPDHRP